MTKLRHLINTLHPRVWAKMARTRDQAYLWKLGPTEAGIRQNAPQGLWIFEKCPAANELESQIEYQSSQVNALNDACPGRDRGENLITGNIKYL